MPRYGSEKRSTRVDWDKFLRGAEIFEYINLVREAGRLDTERKAVTGKIAVLRQRCAKRREVAEKKGTVPPAVASPDSDGYIGLDEDKEGTP